jgi:hypothetical protein
VNTGKQIESLAASACGCKIGRNAEQYGTGSPNEQLLERRSDGVSLRTLENVVNEALLGGCDSGQPTRDQR